LQADILSTEEALEDKKSKLEEIFTYAAIRSQIKDNSYKAIIL
jgi:hypothetical protein